MEDPTFGENNNVWLDTVTDTRKSYDFSKNSTPFSIFGNVGKLLEKPRIVNKSMDFETIENRPKFD